MRVQDWNENFTSFVIDSINEIHFPYQGRENGILNYYHFDCDSFCTRCSITKNKLLFQTVLHIDFEDDIENQANCIERLEDYLREALGLDKNTIPYFNLSLRKSTYYDGAHKFVIGFRINKTIHDNLIVLAKIKGYKI